MATEEDIAAIGEAGGITLHRFNVAMVRVEIDAAALPPLLRPGGGVDYAVSVPDPRRYDVMVQVFFSRTVTDDDEAAMHRLGVWRLGIIPGRTVMYAIAPDHAIPRMQVLSGVSLVRARAILCDVRHR